MAGMGPPPGSGAKDPAQRRRRNKPTPATKLTGAAASAPPFPWEGASDWTKQWYQTWVDAPQSSEFGATDWQRIHDILPLVEAYYASVIGGAPNLEMMKEIRLNMASLGATVADRKRLNWELNVPQGPPERLRPMRPRLKVVDGPGQVART